MSHGIQRDASSTTANPAPATKTRGGSRAVAHSILNRMGMILVNVTTGILCARMLQPHGKGEQAAMILWPLFLASATTLGLPSSLIYFLRVKPESRASLVMNGFAMAFGLGSVAALVAWPLLPHWLHQYSPEVIRAAQWFLLTVPLCSLMLAGQAALEAMGKFSSSNVMQILTPIATLVALAALYFAHRFNAFTVSLAYIVASVPTTVLMLILVWRSRTLATAWRLNLRDCRLLLSYGIRSYGIDLLGALSLQVDQVLVIGLLEPSAMGSYGVMLSLSRMLALFQGAVVMVLFPKAAGKSLETVVGLTEIAMRLTVITTAICGAVICIAGPLLIRLLYGSQFLAAVPALRLLVVEVVVGSAVTVLAQAFMAQGRPGIVTILQGIGLALCVPMMLVLIPRFGTAGAAASLLFSTTMRFLFIYFSFRTFLKTRLPALMPKMQDLRFLISLVRDRALTRQPAVQEVVQL